MEEVAPSVHETITIASNCLQEKDTIIFQSFTKKEKIQVQLLPMSFDSIQKALDNSNYNQAFDAVFLDNTYQLFTLSQKKSFHTLPEKIKHQAIRLRSPNNDWITLGLDPYVLNFGDSTQHTITYNELTYGNPWKAQLSYEQAASFYASVLFQFGLNERNKASNWLMKMSNQLNENDSLPFADYSLNKFSFCQPKNFHFTVPNQVRGGTFYDGYGIGISKHSKNYQILGILIEYLLQDKANQQLTGRLNIFPVNDPNDQSRYDFQNNYPLFFRCSPNQASRQFRDLNRMRSRLKI